MYSQPITRLHRTAFVLMIDRSGSMAEELVFCGRRIPKAEAVAEVANGLLFELIQRATRTDGVRDYYDIAVIGYDGDGVRSLLSPEHWFVPVSELAARETPLRTVTVERTLPSGERTLHDVTAPCWITPSSRGTTPMYEALCRVQELVEGWCARPAHADSFPPVVFNITDGESSDGDEQELRDVCRRIRRAATADGGVFMIHVHIATAPDAQSVLFPTEEVVRTNGSRYARLLYDCSSPMPPALDEAIRDLKGPGARPPFRGMSFNASMAELISVLNIGSISVSIQ